jgi:hypothetical protein
VVTLPSTAEGSHDPSAFLPPKPTVLVNLIKAIDRKIEEDGGALYRHHLKEVTAQALVGGDAFREQDKDFRSHLGASILGHECARKTWYEYRWADKPSFPGRTLRIFNRGHLEEYRFLALFLMMGAQVFYSLDGKQFSISFAGGHAGGSCDAVARYVPMVHLEMPHLLEFKTHNEQSFSALAGNPRDWRDYLAGRIEFEGDGVRKANFEHYVQMQIYLHHLPGVKAALYCAVNKNTDDLYIEEVTYNKEVAEQYVDLAETLILAQTPPPKINQSPGFYKCKFCDMHTVCHESKAPVKSCRTCMYGEPVADGGWYCRKHLRPLTKDAQLAACDQYHRDPVLYGDIPF